MINTSREAYEIRVLNKIPCIYYPIKLQKNRSKNVLALLNSRSEINVMAAAYAAQLGLKIQKIDVGAQTIDRS